MADQYSRTGERYESKEILDYLSQVHAPHDEGLAAAFSAPERHSMPLIMLGQSEARTLELLIALSRAEKVVEVGTLAGYSAIRIARALPEHGKLWTIELDPKHAEIAREAIALSGQSHKVEVRLGKGLDVLPTLVPHGPFDAVFIDADKANYDNYGQWALANLRPGGLIIGDNANYFGHLLDDTEDAGAMRRFHERVAQTCSLSVCIPTAEGMVVGIKK